MNANVGHSTSGRRIAGLDTLLVAGCDERHGLENATLREAACEIAELDEQTGSRLFDGPADVGAARTFIRPDEAREAIDRLIAGAGPEQMWAHLDRAEIDARPAALTEGGMPRNADRSGWIDPSATLDASATVERGVSIGAGARIGTECHLATGTEVRNNATLRHGATIHENCLVGLGATVGTDARTLFSGPLRLLWPLRWFDRRSAKLFPSCRHTPGRPCRL